MSIKIERQVNRNQVESEGVYEWPVWEKEISSFPWTYDASETCYFLEGDVIVTPDGGEPAQMGKGDLVTFPADMSCTWEIRQPVRKHYTFD
ncbi:cupin [Candidatus Tenderia electrophaga]|uniref:Cupin n=1 Tax=Candidatus Tenderia electrophaga TaxID=1748243 RepID=A0A0S2TH07_9GAMM|nr:cupin [Candidatus Tenderia electrophaga]